MSDTRTVTVAFGPLVHDADETHARLRLPTDARRGQARLSARPHRPAVVRDALLALGDVLASDLRFKARDRADYLAYLIAKGKGVSKAVWEAQREFLALKYDAATQAEEPLDPLVTVGEDAVRFEVLSRDESTHACLALRRPAAFATLDATPGATHLDLSPELLRTLGRVRSFRPLTLEIEPAAEAPAVERKVPLRWLRAFGQMAAAAALPTTVVPLAPVDVYNVLHHLRMHKARTSPRALRYELVPGEAPRLVLEPWDAVTVGTGGPFTGRRPAVIRTWGRQRLAGLARLLPHAHAVRAHLGGPGLPAFYVVEGDDFTFTLSLSGWTDAGWGGITTFDQLTDPDPDGLLARLTGLRAGLDLSKGTPYDRPLLATPLPADDLRYRDAREAAAHRLLATRGQVAVAKVHDAPEGRTVEGRVDDREAHRSYAPSFTLDVEGKTSGALCTCATFRLSGVKEGPCEHLIAVRVLYGREQAALEAARGTAEGRKVIRAETRTLYRRTDRGTETFRLSLDGRQVVARFGHREPLRMQRTLFATEPEARAAYFRRLDELERKVWLDGGSGV